MTLFLCARTRGTFVWIPDSDGGDDITSMGAEQRNDWGELVENLLKLLHIGGKNRSSFSQSCLFGLEGDFRVGTGDRLSTAALADSPYVVAGPLQGRIEVHGSIPEEYGGFQCETLTQE